LNSSNFIFGTRAVIEAVRAGKELEKILIQKGLNNQLFHELRKELQGKDIPYQIVPGEKLNRLTNKNHQGVVAIISEITYYKTEELLGSVFESGKIPLVLILDKVTDVRNFGAIARSAECAGADMIVIADQGSAQVNADAIKTSAGALHRIPVCREKNLKRTIEFLKESGLQIVSCHEKTDRLIYDADFKIPTAIIMGSEDSGISPEYLKRSDVQVKIPMVGKIASLNVSVATGIVLFEVIRQRIVNQGAIPGF
jgi:23S rRNA (guanosine2251-2'-O)-methyltransferase